MFFCLICKSFFRKIFRIAWSVKVYSRKFFINLQCVKVNSYECFSKISDLTFFATWYTGQEQKKKKWSTGFSYFTRKFLDYSYKELWIKLTKNKSTNYISLLIVKSILHIQHVLVICWTLNFFFVWWFSISWVYDWLDLRREVIYCMIGSRCDDDWSIL